MGARVDKVLYSTYRLDMDSEDVKVIGIDDAFTEFLGYTKEEVERGEVTLADLIFEEDREPYFAEVQRQIGEKDEAYIAHYVRAKDGHALFVFCYGRNVVNEETGGLEGRITFAELTNVREISQELENNRIMLRDVMDSLVGGVGVFTVDGMKFHADYLSDGFYDVLGIKRNAELGQSEDFSRYLYGEDILKLYDDVKHCIETGDSTVSEYRFIKIDGGFRWMQVRFSLLDNTSKLPRVSSFLLDVTESKQEQIELRNQNEALHFKSEIDSLTGVYNHNAFKEHVNELVGECGEYANGALLMIDLDDFKLVNDVLGHYEGDRVLQQTAQHLNAISMDRGISGRLGGDEFSIFLNKVNSKKEAVLFAAELLEHLSDIKVKTGYSVSVGISFAPKQNRTFHDYYIEADQALYVAKRRGKNQYILYEAEQMSKVTTQEDQTESYFAQAGWVLDDMRDAVYICDPDTDETWFINNALRELIGVEDEDDSWKGKSCYELLFGEDYEKYMDDVPLLGNREHFVHRQVNPLNNRCYICEDQIVRYHGKKARMQVLIDITEWDDVETVLRDRLDMEETLKKCILEVNAGDNFDKSCNRALGILGHYYGAERTYLVLYDDDDNQNIYEWHAERKQALVDSQGRLKEPFKLPGTHYTRIFEQPILLGNIECLRATMPKEYDMLSQIQVWSFYSLPLTSEDVTGCIMMANPKAHLGDLTVARLLSDSLTNEVTKRNYWRKCEYDLLHDKLTDTLNRACYIRDITRIGETDSIGYVVADVDNLKNVNQQFGFEYGNVMVKQIAGILKNAFEGYPVYRFDGDDFAICCCNIARDDFMARVESLKQALDGHSVGASLGYIWDDYDGDVRRLYKHAEDLMKLNKGRKREKHSVDTGYTKDLAQINVEEHIKNGDFLVYLQPKVSLTDNQVCGAEALVRFNHPQIGVVPPSKFIPQLENMGIVSKVDLWMFEQVCIIQSRWKQEGRTLIPVSFNFSRSTMLEEDLVERVEEIVKRYDVDKRYLSIEITESLGEMENDMVAQIAKRLHEQSFHLSMDDFGTKYSSISILSLMQFDELKLDRSMIHNLVENDTSKKVVKHMIAMCDDLGVKCIAEGVETEAQKDLLKSMECRKVQGYLYNRPIPVKEFESLYLKVE